MKNFLNESLPTLLGITLMLTVIASWVNHIYVTFTEANWMLFIAGAFIFPVGIIHGFYRFFF